MKWSQLGGSINDASCLNKTEIYGVIEVRSVDDIANTLVAPQDRDGKLQVRVGFADHHAVNRGGKDYCPDGVRRPCQASRT